MNIIRVKISIVKDKSVQMIEQINGGDVTTAHNTKSTTGRDSPT